MTNRASSVGQVLQIPTSKVKPMPGQPRLHFDRAQLDRLRESIAKIGQQQPATVVPWDDGSYRLRDGERRWRCCRELKIPLTALVVEPRSEEEEFELATAANMNRETHSPLEKALAMKRLRDGRLKRSVAAIAQTFGVSDQTVYNHLLVLDALPQAVLDLMDPNKRGGRPRTLQISAAVRLTVLSDHPSEQLRIAKRIVDEGLPLAQAVHLIERTADKYQIRDGRGLERKPSDHARGVIRAVKNFEVVCARLSKDPAVVEEMCAGMGSRKRQALREDLKRAIEWLEWIAREIR